MSTWDFARVTCICSASDPRNRTRRAIHASRFSCNNVRSGEDGPVGDGPVADGAVADDPLSEEEEEDADEAENEEESDAEDECDEGAAVRRMIAAIIWNSVR